MRNPSPDRATFSSDLYTEPSGLLPRKSMSTIYWDDEMLAGLGRDSQLFNKTVEAKVLHLIISGRRYSCKSIHGCSRSRNPFSMEERAGANDWAREEREHERA